MPQPSPATARASFLLLLLGAMVWPDTAASARMPAPRLDFPQGIEKVARCAPGWRRHTITGRCVRIQPRFPLLSWF